MSRSFDFSIGEYYHCYSRGVEKRNIFLEKKDYERFTALLFTSNSEIPVHLSDYVKKPFVELFELERGEPLVEIGAYCLMSNHFHLLLREKREGGISLFMQKLMTGYTMYFNKKYERTGSLFESSFKAEHADKDRYLKYLFAYIHLNPVKLIDSNWREDGIKNVKKTREFLEAYGYSSYLEYTGCARPQEVIVSHEAFPAYFSTPKDFLKEMTEWLHYKDNELSRLNLDNLE